MKVMHIVGARPNMMKVAPIIAEMSKYPEFEQTLIHTGQHYDYNMSDVFFDDLEIFKPHENLNICSGMLTQPEQIAKIILAFESAIYKYKPDLVIVVGDVNSTLACALTCAKLNISVAHIEAGLRSYDRTMPEEINRILTDQISDLLFTPSLDANENLIREGILPDKIKFVGNIMIDSLCKAMPKAEERQILKQFEIEPNQYILVTLHRPVNVDNQDILDRIAAALEIIAEQIKVIFPVHPRTRQKLKIGINIKLTEPLGYLDFLALMMSAKLVITDSGGIQEETTFLNVPCLTIRQNTERPITIELGTNQLIDNTIDAIVGAVNRPLKTRLSIPPLWDGQTANRIVERIGSSL